MSIQQNFPTISPSLSLNFARSKTLDPRITFSRTSTATRVNETGLIEVMSADEPRFDHKIENGVVKSLGLLVEESRINYEQNTEDPSQWTILNMVPTGNSVTLPTGEVSTTIEYQGETTDANNKLIRPLPTSAAPTAGETWVFSIFLKAGTEDTTRLQLQNNTGGDSVGRTFNMVTGEWTENLYVQGPNTGDSGYEYYGNGWYRVWLVNTYSATAAGQQTFMRLNANSNAVPLTTSFSAWGAQLEKGSFPTSYIPNDTGSQKTRNPDNVSITGTNLTDWFNPDEGTVYADTLVNGVKIPSFNRLWSFTNSNFNLDGLGFYISANANTDGRYGISGEIDAVSIYSPSGIVSTIKVFDTPRMKSCFGFVKGGNCNVSLNGTLPNSNGVTATDFPDIDRFLIGQPQRFQGYSCMTVSQLTYYPRRLTNDQLQNLTK